MEVNDKSYVAGGGTTALGIIGTALGALGVAGNGNSNPLFGGNNRLAEADAKIAKLEAERYTDEKTMRSDVVIAALTEKVNQQEIRHNADLAALNKEYALRAEIDRKQAKIDLLEAVDPLRASVAAHGTAIGGIENVLKGITKIVIPASAVEVPVSDAIA